MNTANLRQRVMNMSKADLQRNVFEMGVIVDGLFQDSLTLDPEGNVMPLNDQEVNDTEVRVLKLLGYK